MAQKMQSRLLLCFLKWRNLLHSFPQTVSAIAPGSSVKMLLSPFNSFPDIKTVKVKKSLSCCSLVYIILSIDASAAICFGFNTCDKEAGK